MRGFWEEGQYFEFADDVEVWEGAGALPVRNHFPTHNSWSNFFKKSWRRKSNWARTTGRKFNYCKIWSKAVPEWFWSRGQVWTLKVSWWRELLSSSICPWQHRSWGSSSLRWSSLPLPGQTSPMTEIRSWLEEPSWYWWKSPVLWMVFHPQPESNDIQQLPNGDVMKFILGISFK